MSEDSLRLAGILLVILPTVAFGGAAYLWLTGRREPLLATETRRRLWIAGHAHAGVLLIISLVALLYVDQAELPEGLRTAARSAIPFSAILVPAGFFFSMPRGDSDRPTAVINLAYLGFVSLSFGLITLGVGVLRAI